MNTPEDEMVASISFKEKLELLTKPQKELFALYNVSGYSIEELAKYYRTTVSSINRRLNKINLILSEEG